MRRMHMYIRVLEVHASVNLFQHFIIIHSRCVQSMVVQVIEYIKREFTFLRIWQSRVHKLRVVPKLNMLRYEIMSSGKGFPHIPCEIPAEIWVGVANMEGILRAEINVPPFADGHILDNLADAYYSRFICLWGHRLYVRHYSIGVSS